MRELRRTSIALVVLAGCGRIDFGLGVGSGAGLDAAGIADDGGAHPDGPRPDANLMFVSSTMVALATLGSLAACDAICQSLAAGAGLSGTYIAWLADSSVGATQRLQIAGAEGFVRIDGLPIADRPTAGFMPMWRPVLFDETGTRIPSAEPVMTGAAGFGQFSGQDCSDYTSSTGEITAGFADGTLTTFTQGTTIPCSGAAHLYCVETDRRVQITPTVTVGRLAFPAGSGWAPGAGIASADAVCTQAATAAGYAGNFLALLATTSATAASRFDPSGLPWVTAVGLPVADTAAEVLAGQLVAPIDFYTPENLYSGPVWFGAPDPQTVGSTADTCNDWLSTSGMERFGADGANPLDGPLRPWQTTLAHRRG